MTPDAAASTIEDRRRVTAAWLERFQQAHDAVPQAQRHLSERARKALQDQFASQIDELRRELAAGTDTPNGGT